jgi:hypothetical protein
LDECLEQIAEKLEFPTDSSLIYLVRLQLLCNKVAVINWKSTPVPQSFYVKTLQSELENLKRSMSSCLESNGTLPNNYDNLHLPFTNHQAETIQLAMYHSIIVIHEHSLDSCPSSTTEVERIESLWSCLSATKSWFTLFFCLDVFPLFRYPQVSMPIFNQFAHGLIVLFRLSTFESPGVHWDRKLVRQEFDLGELVKLIVSRWEEVPTVAGLDKGVVNAASESDEGLWAYTRKKFLVVAHFWEMKLASMIQAEEGRSSTVAENSNPASFGSLDQQQVEGMDFSNMGFLNDIWMGDIAGLELTGPYF